MPSFMRRRYAHDLAGIDLAILDVTLTNRPGARFRPLAAGREAAETIVARPDCTATCGDNCLQ